MQNYEKNSESGQDVTQLTFDEVAQVDGAGFVVVLVVLAAAAYAAYEAGKAKGPHCSDA